MLGVQSLAVLVPLCLLLGFVLYLLYGLGSNYLTARRTGLSLIVLPFDCGNPLWLIIDRKVAQFVRRLPFGAGNFTRFNWRGWEIWDRYRAHQELGEAILFVTPGELYLQLCDPEAVGDVLRRRDDFPRPPEATAMLNVFGPNLGTTGGQTWQRHRKITTSSFSKRVSDLVWAESIRQATGMIRYWSFQTSINSVADDTRTASLHVMSIAIFGQSYPFRGAEEASPASEKDSTTYGNALRLILDRCLPLFILGQKNLAKSWLPSSFKELHQATLAFQDHMTKAYEAEKQAIAGGKAQGMNLMTALVRAAQTDASKKDASPGARQEGMTEEEIHGNIFLFNFAGHDATANSLAFMVCLLATRPDVQDWIGEEISAVLAGADPEETSFEAVFPQLKRCLAVTFETVRLYTAVAIAKSTGSRAQPLTIGGRPTVVPANTMVLPNYAALHTHPRYWGDDSLDFRPERWIHRPGSGGGGGSPPLAAPATKGRPAADVAAALAAEAFREPAKSGGPFVGWSGGARNCPGRRFSQVEIVGVLVGLFRTHRVRPRPGAGEDDAGARARLSRQITWDSGMVLLLQMLHSERAVLQWKRC